MKINWSLDWVKLQTELSYEKVAPTVTYQDIAISILLDVTSKNQRVIDSVNFTEAYAASVGKNLFDEVTLSDSVVKYVIRDYFGDAVSLSDVLGTFNEFLRDRFEEIQASDLEFDGLLNTSLVNEFLLNNALNTNNQVAVTPVSTDLTTMSDALAAVTSTTKTDLTTISDVLAAVTNKLFSDTASTSDVTTSNISKYLASGISLDDFADINKSVNGVKGNIAVMGDTISVSLILSRMLGTRLLNEITLN
jgi:hypothetical protein